MTPSGIVVLISGRGSNLRAILDAVRAGAIPAEVRAVVSSRSQAEGLSSARAAGVPTHIVEHHDYPTREAFDTALAQVIDGYEPKLVACAGFMRILTPDFIRRYRDRLINIHPSLLPKFPGLRTHERALEAGAAVHGATAHFVTPDVDAGPAIIQATVPVRPDDTPESLAARVLEQEHRIFPLAIRWFMENRLSIVNGRVLLDGDVQPEQGLTN